jgi:hypothetical protein
MFTYTVTIEVGGNSDASQGQQDECLATLIIKIKELGVTIGDAFANVTDVEPVVED